MGFQVNMCHVDLQGHAVLPLVEGLPLYLPLRGPALALTKPPNQKATVCCCLLWFCFSCVLHPAMLEMQISCSSHHNLKSCLQGVLAATVGCVVHTPHVLSGHLLVKVLQIYSASRYRYTLSPRRQITAANTRPLFDLIMIAKTQLSRLATLQAKASGCGQSSKYVYGPYDPSS